MQQRPTAKKCTKATCTCKKSPVVLLLIQTYFFFAVLVAVGRCLVFVEPTSAFRLNKISHLESLSSVDSDGPEWNFIPGFVPNMQQNFQDEVENYDPTTGGGGGAEDEDVVISYAGEPLASQPFIQEYNRKRSIEEELRQKLQQSGEEVRTMP